ncbi:unnamed protein product [Bathycoccus prasinos]
MKTPPLTPTKTSRTHHDPLAPLFPNRVIAHFDLDCFYCQVERSLDDSLKEMPTGVCQYDPFERDGVSTRDAMGDRKTHLTRPGANNSLIAVSYEARKKGVKRNMKIGEARRCCPEMIFVQVPTKHSKADLKIYRDAGAKVAAELAKHGTIERASIDEAYLDVTKEANAVLEKCERNEMDFYRDVLMSERVSRSHVAGALEWEARERRRKEKKRMRASLSDGSSGQQEVVVTYASHRDLRRGAVDEIDASNKTSINNNNTDKEDKENEEHVERKAGDPPPQDEASKSWLNRPLSEWSHREKLKIAGAYVCNVAREDCFVNLGYTLSCGVSSNKMLAKLTSGMNKPNCCTILEESFTPSLLEHLPIDRIRGLGGNLGEELSEVLGVTTIGGLAKADRKSLLMALGRDEKKTLWVQRAARGVDDDPVKERSAPKSIATSKTFRGAMCLETTDQVLKWIGELAEELSERTELDGQDWKRHPKTLTLGIRSNLTAHSAHRSHPLSGSGNDCQADNLKTLGGTIFKKFLAEWGIMNNRGFQCTVLSLTTSNFKLEVEKSDVGQGLGKFLKRGVDVFDLFDGGEEKLIMKSAKSSPRKKGEEEENEEQTRFTTLSPPAANKARTTTTMPSSSLHDVSGEDAPLFTKKKKNNVVVVPIAPPPPPEGGEKKNIRPRETLEEKRKREALYNAQLESGIDEETFRSLPPDIQQELRKNKKTKFVETGKDVGFSKAATIPSIASFFKKK